MAVLKYLAMNFPSYKGFLSCDGLFTCLTCTCIHIIEKLNTNVIIKKYNKFYVMYCCATNEVGNTIVDTLLMRGNHQSRYFEVSSFSRNRKWIKKKFLVFLASAIVFVQDSLNWKNR